MRRPAILLTLVLAACLTAPAFAAASSTEDSPQMRVLTEQLDALRLQLLLASLPTHTITVAPAPEAATPALAALEARIEELERELAAIQEKVKAQEQDQERIDQLEKKAALDRLNISGEVRIAADTLNGTQAGRFDGMQLQKGVVDTMFFMQTNGGAFPLPGNPSDPASIYTTLANNVAAHYADYLQFTDGLTFGALKGAMGSFPPAQQAALMKMLMPATYVADQNYHNNILYTTRLRLNLRTEISEHMSFAGRLAMYKAWGDSTGVQVFNGQPTSINTDGTTVGVPNSDIVRVDRAYFDWNHIADSGLYLSLGRRPSSGGPPTEIREGRLRAGTPLGHVVDYQFDGVTVGYSFKKMPGATYRFCYGLGYESGFGSGDQLQSPSSRLKDVHFGGANLDLYSSDRMFVQATALRAWNVTDGFNSLVVMPVNPVTGNASPGPAVMRYTPEANLGNIDLAGGAVERFDGRVTWFASFAGMTTHPENVTTPFGGLLTDPFSTPESHDAWSVYTGARFDVPNGKTQIGGEYNYGSKYWFNFTQSGDEIMLSKLATRGNVYEAYLNQQVGKSMQLRVSAIDYHYNYSGSGWHVGEPKPLDQPSLLGFPTFRHLLNVRGAFTVRF
jgi:TolA-binding protein